MPGDEVLRILAIQLKVLYFSNLFAQQFPVVQVLQLAYDWFRKPQLGKWVPLRVTVRDCRQEMHRTHIRARAELLIAQGQHP